VIAPGWASSAVPRPTLGDRRDQAAFFLNLSRLCGEVVPYRVEGRPAFLINAPALAEQVLARQEGRFWNPPHPYATLLPHYRETGAAVLRLRRDHASRRAELDHLATSEEALPVRWFSALSAASGGQPVEVDFELKRMQLTFTGRSLFGVDLERESAEFTSATNFLEECQANRALEDPSSPADPRAVEWASSVQEGVAHRIAREAGVLAERWPSPETVAQAVTTIIRTLLNAYNATATALSWTLHLLSRHSQVQEALRRDALNAGGGGAEAFVSLRSGRQVVLESLRLFPPAWILGRESLEEQTVGGVQIPRGAIVSVSPYTMHRHRALWEDADDFRPQRFSPTGARPRHSHAYFPFGGGRRSCPAARTVPSYLQVVLCALLRRFRFEAPPDATVRPRGLITLRPDPGVSLRILPLQGS
jgi:cytochrome P450